MYKIINDLTQPYVKQILPTDSARQPTYSLRSKINQKLPVPYCKSEMKRKAFVSKTIQQWNSLPIDILLSQSLTIFKERLRKEYTVIPQPLYSTCSRPLGVHLARMRMGLSGLNYHRFKYNFIENPSCTYCSYSSETVVHFLLLCPSFAALRLTLISQLTPYFVKLNIDVAKIQTCKNTQQQTITILLEGSNDLSKEENLLVFDQVKLYIKDTKRFI